jgi:hypothetical protein
MTFHDAAEILNPYPIVVPYPPKRRTSAEEQREIYIQLSDGTRRKKNAFIIGNFGLLRYNSLWHVIHIHSENAIFESPHLHEAEALVKDIIHRKIDTNWGYRDLHVFKSILQLIGVRKEHSKRVTRVVHPESAATTSPNAYSALRPMPLQQEVDAAQSMEGDQ